MPGFGGGTPFVSPDSNARWAGLSSPGVPILSLLQTPNLGNKDGLSSSPGFAGLFTSPEWTRHRLTDSEGKPPRPRAGFSARVQRRLLDDPAGAHRDMVAPTVSGSETTLATSPAKRQRILFEETADAAIRSSLDSQQTMSALRGSAATKYGATASIPCSHGAADSLLGSSLKEPQPVVFGSATKQARDAAASAALVQLGQAMVDTRSTEWLLRSRRISPQAAAEAAGLPPPPPPLPPPSCERSVSTAAGELPGSCQATPGAGRQLLKTTTLSSSEVRLKLHSLLDGT